MSLPDLPNSPIDSEIDSELNSAISTCSHSPIVELQDFIPIKEEKSSSPVVEVPIQKTMEANYVQNKIDENDLSPPAPPAPPAPPPSPSYIKPTIIEDLVNISKKELRVRLSNDKNNIILQDLPPIQSMEDKIDMCQEITTSIILLFVILLSSPILLPCAIGYYGFKCFSRQSEDTKEKSQSS